MKKTALSLKLFLTFLLLLVKLYANENITMALSQSSNKYNISSALLLAIIMVESNMNKNAIGAVLKTKYQKNKLKKYLHILNCKFKTRGNERYWSIYPKSIKDANKVILVLQKFKINYDLGLAQINSYNIEKRNLNQKKLLKDEKYVIDIEAKILKECIRYNNWNVHNSIECYNKGTNKKKYTYNYSKKVLRKYEQIKKDGNFVSDTNKY